jgi:hypothetical protein
VRPGKHRGGKRDVNMVADAREFTRVLKARKYPDLKLKSEVIAGEDHLTVNPVSYTRGLLWALGTDAARTGL